MPTRYDYTHQDWEAIGFIPASQLQHAAQESVDAAIQAHGHRRTGWAPVKR
jgi:hypothetical protein